MTVAVRGIFAGQSERTQVRYDQRIYLGVVQPFQVGGQLSNLVISWHGVYGHMDLDTIFVGEADSLRDLVQGKITCKGTHTKVRSRKIDSICTVGDGHFQPFHIPGGA